MRLLDGIRVPDFGRFVAGPYCAALLGDYGVDVIRIERVEGGVDHFVPAVTDSGEGGMYLQTNRNKRCLTLDLASAAGRAIVQQLVRGADGVVANLPPATLRRLGLEYATLSQINPRIVLVAATAYGPTGPYSQQNGFASVGQAMGGAMCMSGLPGAPVRASGTYVDFLPYRAGLRDGRVGGPVGARTHRAWTAGGGLVAAFDADPVQRRADRAGGARAKPRAAGQSRLPGRPRRRVPCAHRRVRESSVVPSVSMPAAKPDLAATGNE